MATKSKRKKKELSQGQAEQLARVIVKGLDYLHYRDRLEEAQQNLQKELLVGASCGLSQAEMAEQITGDLPARGRPGLSRQRVSQIMFPERWRQYSKNGKSRSK